MGTDNRTSGRARSDLSQTLARGLRLLDLIAGDRAGVPVRELAAAMRLPRSIVQRLLYTLEAEGFVERDPSQVGYRLTVKLWSLGCAATHGINLRDLARPRLEDLARKTEETIKLAVLEAHDVVYLDGIESPQSVRAYVPVGGRAPAHVSATGKAILAFLPAERLARLGAAAPHAPRSVAAAEAFARDLGQIRRRGFAVNRGEWDPQVGAVAAPVFGGRGDVLGSLGIILPASRLTAAKTVQMGAWAVEAAAAVSARLGHATRPNMKRAG